MGTLSSLADHARLRVVDSPNTQEPRTLRFSGGGDETMRGLNTGVVLMTAALLALAGGAVADEVTFSFVPPDGWQI